MVHLPTLALLATSALAVSIPSPQQHILDTFTSSTSKSTAADICPLAPKVSPPNDGLHPALRFVQDESIRAQQVARLSRAVQVPTTVDDYMDDPYDEKFAPFVEFQKVLAEMFPLVHHQANIEHINRLGLLITLNGTNQSLKPLLFTAHQDVVPIDDPSDWTHPPFAGHYDGQWLWGRGASDCKNVLIGLLSTVEDLLQQNWFPTRTVVLAFGFDEESHGFLGAGAIATALAERFGRDSFEFVLDEGGMGLQSLNEDDDVVYALPGVGEKGSIDLVLDLHVAGGHSSVPPQHTGIGVVAEIVYALERQDLFVPMLGETHPSRRVLECQVRHSPGHVESWLAKALGSDDHVAIAEAVAASRGEKVRFTLQTSQAADLIHGGVKTNALPEKISVTMNYRVALHETPGEIQQRAIRIIEPIVKKYNISFSDKTNANTNTNKSQSQSPPDVNINTLTLSTLNTPLNPAPQSPTSPSDKTWTHFSGITRSVFESAPSLSGKTVVVAGDIMTGNTDTRFYWDLSRNIYRWGPARVGGALNIHTVDERVDMEVHLEGMMVYYDLMRAFDRWEGGEGVDYARDGDREGFEL